jgi:hypothetical protein
MFYRLFLLNNNFNQRHFSTGEKKCNPINLSVLVDALASCDMGIVEVLDA